MGGGVLAVGHSQSDHWDDCGAMQSYIRTEYAALRRRAGVTGHCEGGANNSSYSQPNNLFGARASGRLKAYELLVSRRGIREPQPSGAVPELRAMVRG